MIAPSKSAMVDHLRRTEWTFGLEPRRWIRVQLRIVAEPKSIARTRVEIVDEQRVIAVAFRTQGDLTPVGCFEHDSWSSRPLSARAR